MINMHYIRGAAKNNIKVNRCIFITVFALLSAKPYHYPGKFIHGLTYIIFLNQTINTSCALLCVYGFIQCKSVFIR